MAKGKWRGGKGGLKRARQLRGNSTNAEARLRHRQLQKYKFRRQVPIGPFVVDFLCAERRLVIELDGGQHASNIEHDKRRDAWLQDRGYSTLRFWNNQVLVETDAVLEKIIRVLEGQKTDGT